MLENIRFTLSYGYLSKNLMENDNEMAERIVSRILEQLPAGEKVECYHGCLESGWTDGEMVFDYLILYKMDDEFKPIIVKNGIFSGCYMKWFEKCYDRKENMSFYVNELLEVVCESSREKFHIFLQEKYNDIVPDILSF
jgi:hypothetical protein